MRKDVGKFTSCLRDSKEICFNADVEVNHKFLVADISSVNVPQTEIIYVN